MDYKQIVFDIDGTLIDTEYAVLHSLQDTVLELDKRLIPIQALSFALGITGEDALRHLGVQDIAVALSLWDRKMAVYQDTIRVFQGIEEMLAALAQQNIGLGIVTSKTREEFKHDFSHFSIASCFQTVVCADDTSEHKPAPAPLLKYMELAKCQSRELLYVGDSIYDMQCAQRANVRFGLAKWGAGDRVTAALSFSTPGDLMKQLCAPSSW